MDKSVGSHQVIAVSSHSLAHQALVQKGALFSDRPKPLFTAKILSTNKHNISSACYGPTWRILRRNLISHTLHPSQSKKFSQARKWVLDMLLDCLRVSSVTHVAVGGVGVMDHFRFAMFSLLVFMCFGEKHGESHIREIEAVQRRLLSSFNRFFILDFCWPSVTRILFSGLWNELYTLKKKREELLLPHIRTRKRMLELSVSDQHDHLEQAKTPNGGSPMFVTSYVDTLLALELPEEGSNTASKRKLSEEELVNLCSEFLNAGTDTTSAALQWIMANLIKYPCIQAKLFEEIKEVIGEQSTEVGENELPKMPYLQAVVLEGLRRHPPSHFTLPHAVTQDVELGGYVVPKNTIINFMVGEMGLDSTIWENPMQFKPERFLTSQGTEEFDITGSRDIKMMPFGVGRRMCPGLGLAMLHLKYFVANLVWKFEWNAIEGYEVDLAEKQDFSIVMKHPFHAHIFPRQTK